MAAKLGTVRSYCLLACLLTGTVAAQGQPPGTIPEPLVQAHAQEWVEQVLATELRAAQDTSHPMRYMLRKQSPRLTTTKEIIETRDGAVARLIAVFDRPLSPADAQKEEARLTALWNNPALQRHRKQSEEADTGRALEVLRALPSAFLYQYAGSEDGPGNHRIDRFTFVPNPRFSPPNLETQVLTAMSGQIWIDAQAQRVTRLEAHLQQDVNFGWGILGRLNKGGWIVIEQADVGENQWRTVRFQMALSGRVVFKTRAFDTEEEQSRFAPVPVGMGYRQAITLLRGGAQGAAAGAE